MKTKEQGFVLSIDQASNNAGASLWYNGELKHWVLLSANSPKDPYSLRLQTQAEALDVWLHSVLPDGTVIKQILFEGVRRRLVLCTVGAFCISPKIQAVVHDKKNFVESTSWKKYAQLRGATGLLGEVKGVKALREIGFPLDRYPITSDDIADSILIYLTWKER